HTDTPTHTHTHAKRKTEESTMQSVLSPGQCDKLNWPSMANTHKHTHINTHTHTHTHTHRITHPALRGREHRRTNMKKNRYSQWKESSSFHSHCVPSFPS